MSAVPSLRSLCLKLLDDSILNLDNGPFVYDFARSHGFSTLEARAAKFCTESYRGLRAKHGPEVLHESLGTEMFVALETNHNTIEAQRQRISRMGTVLPDGIAPPVQPVRPPQPSPSMTAASAVAQAAPAKAPSADTPSSIAHVSCGSVTRKLTLNAKILAKSLKDGCITPFLVAYNKKYPDAEPLTADALSRVEVDGIIIASIDAIGGSLLLKDMHKVELFPPGSPEPTAAASTAPLPTPANASKPRSIFGGGGEKCAVCFKTVYQAERTLADGRPFHHACVRCVTCACKLSLSSFERIEDGRLYCKAHFMQQWLERSSGAATQLGAPIPAAPATSSADGQGGAATSSSAAAGGDLRMQGVTLDMNLGMNLGSRSNPSSGSAAPAEVPAPPPMCRIGPTFHAPVAPSVGSWVASQTVCCERCGKKVYANERQDAMAHRSHRLLVFHRACFRCIDCNTLLRGNNFELFLADDAAEGSEVLCCRTHFMARRSLPLPSNAPAPTDVQ